MSEFKPKKDDQGNVPSDVEKGVAALLALSR